MSKAASGGGDRQAAGARTPERVVYCVVPRDLAPALHEHLRGHFAGDPSVKVIVERRGAERRTGDSPAVAEGRRIATPEAPTGRRTERRQVRSVTGRRIADRRALAVAVDVPALPRRARRHADRIVFVERLDQPDQRLQDIDSHRLVVSYQAGDQAALNVLYLRYFDAIYQYARVALRDPHSAEDATQQTFTRVVQALPRYEVRLGKPFRAWLFRIARNVVLDTLGKDSRTLPEEPSKLDARLESASAPVLEPPSALGWLSDPELALFVERLPEPQRQVIALRFMFDLSTDEIAAILDRTPKAIRKMQSRALQRLNDRLTALDRGSRSQRTPVRVRMKNLPVLAERRFALGRSRNPLAGARAAYTRR